MEMKVANMCGLTPLSGLRYLLWFEVGVGVEIRKGDINFYIPHGRYGDDGESSGVSPKAAIYDHELGHARAYWEHVRPCAEKIHKKFGNRSITAAERKEITEEYKQCKTKAYWEASAKYANKASVDWYNIKQKGKYKALRPQMLTYGGRQIYAMYVWQTL